MRLWRSVVVDTKANGRQWTVEREDELSVAVGSNVYGM